LFIGWLLRSVLPVSLALGASPVKDLNAAAFTESTGSSHRGQQLGGSYRTQAGQAGGQSVRIDAGQRVVAGCFVAGAFGLRQAQ
jgi:hypothetical protein